MIIWACGTVTLLGALIATFSTDLRRTSLALWIAGLGAGGIYLSLGAELLAISQWIVSTLLSIAFILYSVLFGEYGLAEKTPLKKQFAEKIAPVLLGAAFAGMIGWVGNQMVAPRPKVPAVAENRSEPTSHVASVGKVLTEDHFLSLQILAFTLFLSVVGAGVIARPENQGEEESP